VFLSATVVTNVSAQNPSETLGIFESHGDVGTLLHPSNFAYDPGRQTYTITASGENVWFAKDNFHFAWIKVDGDGIVQADISFVGKGANPHRKALLMIRQSLDADSPYADIALHGNGMTALQIRDEKGGLTHETQAALWSPKSLRIEKHGDYLTMWLAGDDGVFHFAAGSHRLQLSPQFYVGIGMGSHQV